MKAKRGDMQRAIADASSNIRFFLLYGPDRAGSEGIAKELYAAIGEEAERVDLASGDLKSDPALLADEAASISLFGGKRYIRIDPAGDEIFSAVEALGEAEQAGNPVIAVAGALRGTNRLVKLANASKAMLAFVSYLPDARDAARMAIEVAQAHGVQLSPDVARRLADSCGGDRAILTSEIEKFANYLDAAPDRPRPLDHDAIDAVGAANGEGDMNKLANMALSGNVEALDAELTRLRTEGLEGVPLIRALLRRLMLLADLRAQMASGESAGGVVSRAGRAIFWKEKDMVTRQLQSWNAPALATAIARATEAERALKSSGGPGTITADEEIFAIARKARSLRG